MKTAILVVLFSLFVFRSHSADYQINLDARAGIIQVEACFDNNKPNYLVSSDREGVKALSRLSDLEQRGRRLYLTTTDNCAGYEVDLHRLESRRKAKRFNDSWVVDNGSWLWRPKRERPLQLSFNLPQQQLSMPWLRNGNRYIAGLTHLHWQSRMAFGDIIKRQITSGGTALQAAFVGYPEADIAKLEAWLQVAADGVSAQFDRFPVDSPQILVVQTKNNREPVPWAEVQRGGSPSAHYFVDPSHNNSVLMKDWTVYHELSHLFLPKVNWRDRWISEGLATYFQNVTMVHMQTLSTLQAINKFEKGFNRGRNAASSRPLRGSRSTMHVYWGGAAIFTLADLKLRSLDTSLAQVLAKFNQCCLPSQQSWSAEALMAKLDSLSGSKIFTSLLHQQASSRDFPLSKRDFAQMRDTGTLSTLLKSEQPGIDRQAASP